MGCLQNACTATTASWPVIVTGLAVIPGAALARAEVAGRIDRGKHGPAGQAMHRVLPLLGQPYRRFAHAVYTWHDRRATRAAGHLDLLTIAGHYEALARWHRRAFPAYHCPPACELRAAADVLASLHSLRVGAVTIHGLNIRDTRERRAWAELLYAATPSDTATAFADLADIALDLHGAAAAELLSALSRACLLAPPPGTVSRAGEPPFRRWFTLRRLGLLARCLQARASQTHTRPLRTLMLPLTAIASTAAFVSGLAVSSTWYVTPRRSKFATAISDASAYFCRLAFTMADPASLRGSCQP